MSKKKFNKEEKKKIKILVWADSPAVATGFATVSRGIFTPLANTGRYDIDIIGINDRGGWKSSEKYPYRIFPARSGVTTGDYYGRDRLVASMLQQDPELAPPWDIVFTLNDPFITDQKLPVYNTGTMKVLKEAQETVKQKLPPDWHYKIVSYWPIDSELRGNWVKDNIALSDYPVAYSKYGEEMINYADDALEETSGVKEKLQIIYHGVNTKEFYPLKEEQKKEFRQKYFEGKLRKDTFLVTTVARNQLRKDLPRTMLIFKEFKKRRPDSFLYLHCQEKDAWGSLREYARNWNLKLGEDWAVPAEFSSNIGYPIAFMNLLYNSSDAILSTSLGEGFGFYNLESFATKSLVIGPNNTTHPELYNYDKNEDISNLDSFHQKLRGIPIKTMTNSSEWATYGPQDFERVRPLVNVEDAVNKLIWAYDNQDKTKEIAERGYNWVQDYDWSKVAQRWDSLFQDVYKQLKDERAKVKYNPNKIVEAASLKQQRDAGRTIPETEAKSIKNEQIPSVDNPPAGQVLSDN